MGWIQGSSVAVAFLRLAGLVLAVGVGAACSKDTTVNAGGGSAAVGQQCSGPDDEGCGVGARCVLGYCRLGCTTDTECEQGSICVGDRAPFGCALPAELACSSTQPCAPGLSCGLDGKCRIACTVTTDCPRNEQACRGGTCVGVNEGDFTEVWGECLSPYTQEALPSGAIAVNPEGPAYACDVGSPGLSVYAFCEAGEALGIAIDTAAGGPGDVPTCVAQPAECAAAGAGSECAAGADCVVCEVECAAPCGAVDCDGCFARTFSGGSHTSGHGVVASVACATALAEAGRGACTPDYMLCRSLGAGPECSDI